MITENAYNDRIIQICLSNASTLDSILIKCDVDEQKVHPFSYRCKGHQLPVKHLQHLNDISS